MNNEERRNYLGGSEIAAAMGLNRWQTPLKLWAVKTGVVAPDNLDDVEAVQIGIELEEPVAKMFEKKTGFKVRKAPCLYIGEEPWMRCQVDRLLTGTDELLEVKTCSAWKEKDWDNEEIPIEYILQVSWQLMITGRKVGWIAVLIGGQKFRYKKILADQELFDKMTEAAKVFWNLVQSNTPPGPMGDDNSFLVELFPRGNDQMLMASQEVTDLIGKLNLVKSEIKTCIDTKDELEARLKAIIGEAGGIQTPEFIARWINVKGSTYTVTKPDSRQLRITKIGGR
jgi:putative phage-type endonuclease